MLIELESPAINLIGFEHAPVNDEQKSIPYNAKQTLAATDRLFYFSTTICRSENVGVEAPYRNHHEDKKYPHDEKHTDFHASYTFKCEQAKDLQEITIKLFALFPGIHEIKAQWIFHNKQGAASLTPDNNTLQVN